MKSSAEICTIRIDIRLKSLIEKSPAHGLLKYERRNAAKIDVSN